MCKESNEDDTKDALQNKQRAHTSLQFVYSCVFTCLEACVHVKHVVVLVVLRIRVIFLVIVSVSIY